MLAKIRNIALISHRGVGKTSLAEALFFKAKKTDRLGSVDNQTSFFDFQEEERKRKTTITSKLGFLEWNGCKINIIDTPGYLDFIGEIKANLRVVEGVILLVDCEGGVMVGTEIAWKVADEYNIPVIIFINKLEKEQADLQKAVSSIRKKLSPNCVCLFLPNACGPSFSAITSILKQEDPEKEKLYELISETDDILLEKYLNEGSLSEEEVMRGLKKGIKTRKIFPIICGSALKEIGSAELLDAIVNLIPPPEGSTDDPLSAFVFKVISDPHVGELTFVKVFSGKLEGGMEVYNSTQDIKEKLGHICYINGKARQDISSIPSGDIGVCVKLKGTKISDTLCSPKSLVSFPKIDFPEPVISIGVSPKTKQDQERMSNGLHKLSDEDPTFTSRYEVELHQTIISGMGELHLEIMLDKLKNRFQTEVIVEKPRVPYRESIRIRASGEGKYKRQTGGRGQYGHSLIHIEPLPPNSEDEFIFENKIFGGAIPAKYIPAVEKGIKECVDKGILAGYPVKWVKIILHDGSFHEVDSSDIAFQLAGSFAFKDAFSRADSYLLEPIMDVEVFVEEEYTGDIVSDLNGRRGRIVGIEGGSIKALVPQEEMFKYSTTLRSITQGRGNYVMRFSHYEEVPSHLANKIVEEKQQTR
ncbi:TPA: elongation factor G [bacterium]|nr:elongation factor G [bacterium]